MEGNKIIGIFTTLSFFQKNSLAAIPLFWRYILISARSISRERNLFRTLKAEPFCLREAVDAFANVLKWNGDHCSPRV